MVNYMVSAIYSGEDQVNWILSPSAEEFTYFQEGQRGVGLSSITDVAVNTQIQSLRIQQYKKGLFDREG